MKDIQPFFESQRLIFIRPRDEDLQFIKKLLEDPEIMKFQGGAWTGQWQEDFFKFVHQHWERFGFGHFMALLKEDHKQVGAFSLKYLNSDPDLTKDVPDFGCFISKELWRQGFATEGAAALVDYGFTQLKLKEIGALNDPDNLASRKALVKLGFKELGQLKETIYNGRDFGRSVQWRITAEQWKTVNRTSVGGRQGQGQH